MLKPYKAQRPWKKNKGQSTVEYIILVAAVIAVLIVFLPGMFSDRYEAALTDGTDGMEDMSLRLKASRPCVIDGAVADPSACQ